MTTTPTPKSPPPSDESLKRWAGAIKSDATNVQILSQESPTTEEGFLVLSIIVGRPLGVKQFNVAHAIQELVNRQRKHVEYFSTNKEGDKIGVSLEWREEKEESK